MVLLFVVNHALKHVKLGLEGPEVAEHVLLDEGVSHPYHEEEDGDEQLAAVTELTKVEEDVLEVDFEVAFVVLHAAIVASFHKVVIHLFVAIRGVGSVLSNEGHEGEAPKDDDHPQVGGVEVEEVALEGSQLSGVLRQDSVGFEENPAREGEENYHRSHPESHREVVDLFD